MLNEKVTITICGKNYRLKTDNSEQTVAAAKDIEERISGYCSESLSVTKEDASVFAALDCLNELYEMADSCKTLAAEVERLKKGEEAAKKAVDE
ncbi:MAG: cell division protein ZapA, partial [Oscillospiraceae bacterium]|nr:cell division protein ZapA [Oscillospiraceae bacterium]